jgi:hypothetical protein
MKVDPNVLNVIGLLFGIIGGVYLSIDALAPDGLIEALEDVENHKRQLTSVSFVKAITKIFTILLITLAGFLVLHFYVINDLVTTLVLASLSYPIYKLAIKFFSLAFDFATRLSPAKKFAESSLILKIVKLIFMLPWFITLTLLLIVNQVICYCITKPIEVISTYIFGGLSFRMLKSVGRTCKIEKEYSFRIKSFFGLMFLCLGFFYQLVATVIILCTSH